MLMGTPLIWGHIDRDNATIEDEQMMNRRSFVAAAASVVAAPALANTRLPDKYRPQIVGVHPVIPAGQIHVVKQNFFFYLFLGNGQAKRYGIALGSTGRNYTGVLTIRRKAEWPSWVPTQNMINLEPDLYGPYKAGLPGGHPRNPMGSRALYLHDANGRDTYYRIHGTHDPQTIGTRFSSGCVRLTNDDVADLYQYVPVGTKVFIF